MSTKQILIAAMSVVLLVLVGVFLYVYIAPGASMILTALGGFIIGYWVLPRIS